MWQMLLLLLLTLDDDGKLQLGERAVSSEQVCRTSWRFFVVTLPTRADLPFIKSLVMSHEFEGDVTRYLVLLFLGTSNSVTYVL